MIFEFSSISFSIVLSSISAAFLPFSPLLQIICNHLLFQGITLFLMASLSVRSLYFKSALFRKIEIFIFSVVIIPSHISYFSKLYSGKITAMITIYFLDTKEIHEK